MTDHNLRDIASRCEAKLHGLRRTAEGAVISFVIHPNEIPRALMLDALGTRYMLAFVAIGDDEQPTPTSPPGAITGASLGHSPNALTPKVRYAAMTAGEQAVQRAAMLPKDERFKVWVASEIAGAGARRMYAETEANAADFIRDRCCGGASRKLIAEDPEAMDRFIDLETRFKIAVGELPEIR